MKTGTYTLIVQLDSGKYAKQKVKVKAGRTTKVGRITPTKKPVTVKGSIKGAKNGFVTFNSRPTASGRQANAGSASITSKGRFTARVVPGTWSVHAVGDTAKGMIGTAATEPRLKITKTKTVSIPVKRLTKRVTAHVTLGGKPVVGLYFRTENPKSTGDEYFRGNFYVDGEKSPAGTYLGSWGSTTPVNSPLHVYDDSMVLPSTGPYYFAATTTVSKPSDLSSLKLVLKGGV